MDLKIPGGDSPLAPGRVSTNPTPAAPLPATVPAGPSAPVDPKGWANEARGARPVATPTTALPHGTTNEYKMVVKDGPPVAAGSALHQAKEAALTGALGLDAAESVGSGGRLPPDFLLRAELRALNPTPPIAGQRTTQTTYTSHIPNRQPAAAYQAFVNNPAKVFGAAGLALRPDSAQLRDGDRLFLQDKGPPPAFMPVQVKLDPKNLEVHITTLDGHPFNGTNDFKFQPDGKGGTHVIQESAFQGSSPLIEVAKKLGAIEKQHAAWQNVHQFLFDTLTPKRSAA